MIIKNIIKWWPILKEDYDWDYYYLLKVIKFKLDKMAAYHSEKGITLNKDEIVREMNEASSLIKQLMEDDFFDYSKLEAKWGVSEMKVVNDYEIELVVPNANTDEEKEVYSKEFKAEARRAEKLTEATLDKFCKLFKEKLFGWWD